MVHYEIPWNPNRLEQRNGRVDRHGQKASKVLIHHFVGVGFEAGAAAGRESKLGELEGDLEFLMRVARKVETIREDLGKVGPVLASQVEEAMLGKRRTIDTSAAEVVAQKARRYYKFERNLREQCARLKERLDESRRELRLAPAHVRKVVEIGLELAGQPPLREAQVRGLWPAGPSDQAAAPLAGANCSVFWMPKLMGSWARCSDGLRHPHTQEVRPIVFDDTLAVGRDDVVLCHLHHRLVQMCLRLLRAEIWARGSRRRLHRVTARMVSRGALDHPAVVAHGRLVVLGRKGHCLHEEMIAAGGLLREGRFARLNVAQVREALAAATDVPAPGEIWERLQSMWPRTREAIAAAVEARMRERTRNLQTFLEQRQDQEIADVRAILEDLRRRIEAEMEEPAAEQLLLWSNAEKEQLRRNLDSLKARVREIPAEIEREARAICERYEGPEPRLFPVSVTFLIPDGLR